MQKAQELARQKAGQEAVNIYVEDGIYYLPNTLVFKPTDSGAEGKEITYQAINEGKAIISGGLLLDLNWQLYKEGIYQRKKPAHGALSQL